MPHRTFLVLVLHLVVGECRPTGWTPVDEVLASINKAPLVQGYKDFPHCNRQTLVQREPLPRPVYTRAELCQLMLDDGLVFVGYLPGLFHKGFTTHLVAVAAFFFEFDIHDVLRGNSRMVAARNPQGWIALHAAIAHLQVLQTDIEGVPDMENTCYVRRRNNDSKRLFAVRRAGLKIPA